MRIGLVVNDIMTEQAGYTTTRLAITAMGRGHEVWVIGVADLAYDTDEQIHARASRPPKKKYTSRETYLKDLKGSKAIKERIVVDDLDVLFLRNDPSTDAIYRPWAQHAGLIFGRVALRHGVIVLNDPNGLAKAHNKMYFQLFPEEVRPRTVITRDRDEIKEFVKKEKGTAVLKPLQGSGGAGVPVHRARGVEDDQNSSVDILGREVDKGLLGADIEDGGRGRALAADLQRLLVEGLGQIGKDQLGQLDLEIWQRRNGRVGRRNRRWHQ